MANRFWTPYDLGPIVALWFDAQDSSTVKIVNGTVSKWFDKSSRGNHATQATISAQATYSSTAFPGGKPAIVTNGSKYYNLTAAVPYANGNSIYAAVEQNGAATTRSLISAVNSSGQECLRFIPDGRTSLARSSQVELAQSTDALSVGAHIIGADTSSTGFTLYNDGNNQGSSTTNPAFTNKITALFIDNDMSALFNGAVGEIVLTTASLSTTQRQLLEGYLAWKWGTVALLPSSHPYKNAQPTVTDNTSLWTPKELGTLLFEWWDPSSGILFDDSNLVQSWTGRIGGTVANQTSTTSRPSFIGITDTAGNPRLKFVGGANLRFNDINFPRTSTNTTIAISASFNNINNASNGFTSPIGWGNGNTGGRLIFANGGNISGAIVGVGDVNSTVSWNSSDRCVVFTAASNSQNLYIDGNSSASGATAFQGNNQTGPGGIGVWPPYGGTWDGNIGHVLVFNDVLTSTQRQLVEGWESWNTGKNGSNLPANHPYKNAAPLSNLTGRRPFAPTDTSKLWSWHDASDTTTTILSNGKVSIWKDKSGSNRDVSQSNPSYQPTILANALNGMQAIDFRNPNTPSLVSAAGFVLPQPFTLVGIFSQFPSSPNYSVILDADSKYGATSDRALAFNRRGDVSNNPTSYAGTNKSIGPTITTLDPYIASWLFDNSGCTGAFNGVPAYNGTIGTSSLVNGFAFGQYQDPSNTLANCLFHELIIIADNSPNLIRLAEGYLAWKWGQQNYLTPQHPYKTASPKVNTASASTGTDLTANNTSTSSPTFGNPSLSQTANLTANNTNTSSPTFGSPTSNQIVNFNANNTNTSSPSMDQASFNEVNNFSANDTKTQSPIFDSPSINQTQNLSANNTTTQSPYLESANFSSSSGISANSFSAGPPSFGSPAVAQTHNLSANNTNTSSPTFDSPSASLVHVLSANNTNTQSPSSTQPMFTQIVGLSANDTNTQSPSFDKPTIAQTHNISANSTSTSSPVTDSANLAQTHALSANDLNTTSPSFDSPSFNQSHSLNANSLNTSSPSIDQPSINQTQNLSANDTTTSSPHFDSPSTTGQTDFYANDLNTTSPEFTQPEFKQIVTFTANDLSTSSIYIDSPNMHITHEMTANDLSTQSPVIDQPTIVEDNDFTANDLQTSSPVIDSPAIYQTHKLSANSLKTSSPIIDQAVIYQTHSLNTSDFTTSSPTLGKPALKQTHGLIASDLNIQSPVIDIPSATTEKFYIPVTAVDLNISSPIIGKPSVKIYAVLSANNLNTSSINITNAPFKQIQKFSASDLTISPVCINQTTITQNHKLNATNLTLQPYTYSTPYIVQRVNLQANNLNINSISTGSPIMKQIHNLSANDLTLGSPLMLNPVIQIRNTFRRIYTVIST